MKKFAILQKTEVVTVSLLSLVLFLRMFSIFLVLPVFNILAQEVKYANFFLVALAFGIYGLTQGLCQLPAGYFSDVWVQKKSDKNKKTTIKMNGIPNNYIIGIVKKKHHTANKN